MRRPRRRSLRWPSWLQRRPGYRRNVALHAHEERVLLALIAERDAARQVLNSPKWLARTWDRYEPGRWDERYLTLAFKRLRHTRGVELRGLAHFERRAA